jgi:transitional endoplasmic reticulum ATPase
MSFRADKKREHEQLAERALARKDYAAAFFHTAKAADFGFNLAEHSQGKVARAHLNDANELLDIAARLKEKARAQDLQSPRRVIQEHERATADEEQAVASDWQILDRPDVKLDDVAGLDEVKAALRDDVLNAITHPDVYERFKVEGGGGVLMYGPPGNGKTFIAKAIAGELDAAFFAVDASQIKNKYVGETEKNMRRLFEEARRHPRAVIFLDEIDALLQKRGNQKVNAVTQFLILADGIAKTGECTLLLLGATNKPWAIDPAALRPGRFGKQIYVGLPDQTAREAIIRYSLKEVPVEDAFSFEDIAARSEGYSGADLAEICRRAKKAAIRRQIASGQNEVVRRNDLDQELMHLNPSVSAAALAEYVKWREDHSACSDRDEADDAT